MLTPRSGGSIPTRFHELLVSQGELLFAFSASPK